MLTKSFYPVRAGNRGEGGFIRGLSRRTVVTLLLVVLGLVGIAVFLRSRGISFDWHKFLLFFVHLNPWWYSLSVLLALSTYAGRVIRWEVMLRPLQPNSKFWELFSATAIGFTAIVLFGRAGEVVRPYLIATKAGVSFSSQMAAWFLERVYDLLVVLLLVGLALSSYGHLKLGAGPAVQFILAVGGKVVILASLASLVVLVMARHFSEVMAQRLCDSLGFLPPHVQGKVRSIVHSFVEGMESTKDTTSVVLIVFYTLLEWGIIVACFYCMFRSIPETASYTMLQSAVFVGFVAFGSIVQLPGIGGGMQLAGIVVLTELFGLPLETATGVALLNWLSTFVIIVPFGLFLAAREGLKWGNLRHIQEVKGE